MIAQELRIGNLAYYPTVNLNTGEQIFELIEITAKNILEHSMRPIYHPIPLTEEKLVEFGFFNNGTTYSFPKSKFLLYRGRDAYYLKVGDWLDTKFGNCEIQFLHQLQNLYFALTGEELTLKTNDAKAN